MRKKLLAGVLGFSLLISLFSGVSAAGTTKFTDIKGHWAESLINEAVERGFVSGISDTRFAPNDKLTYEQFMVMLARMFTEKNYMEDPVSGCKMILTNYNEEFKATNGDEKALHEYRQDYLKNNPDLNENLALKSSKVISDFNNPGYCHVRSWKDYKTSPIGSSPYYMDDEVSPMASNWARGALTTVPYIAGFASYYDFIANNGEHIKDFNYTASKNGLTPLNFYTWTDDYQTKRIRYVYDKLNYNYIEHNISDSLSRADMALILYTFLNYEEQKLINYKQDNFYYGTWSSSSNPWYDNDLNYKNFKSKYTDLPKYFQFSTMKANNLETATFYRYMPERIFAKNAIGIDGKKHTNYEAEHTTSGIYLTSRGIILAVSDAGLISGSGGKFNPDKSLTRAEGVAVALKLDDFLKKRYNFVGDSSNVSGGTSNNDANETDNIKNTLSKYYDSVYAKDLATFNGTWVSLSDKSKQQNEDWFKNNTYKYTMDTFNPESVSSSEATILVDIITAKVNTSNPEMLYAEMKGKQKFKIYMKKIDGTWKIDKMELVGNIQHLPNDNPEEF